MAQRLVKCLYCEKYFDREKTPCIQIGRRYAHKTCVNQQDEKIVQEDLDKVKFYELIKQIYGKDYNFILINTQAENFIKQHGYTWSGMTACLHWFYNLNHGNLEEGHGGIGIIPFIYDEVREYYTKIYKTQEKNKNFKGRKSVINFNIQSPRAWKQPPHLLDMEE